MIIGYFYTALYWPDLHIHLSTSLKRVFSSLVTRFIFTASPSHTPCHKKEAFIIITIITCEMGMCIFDLLSYFSQLVFAFFGLRIEPPLSIGHVVTGCFLKVAGFTIISFSLRLPLS